jgi:hypothetical protein
MTIWIARAAALEADLKPRFRGAHWIGVGDRFDSGGQASG